MYSVDVGSNLTSLGFAYLFFKFLLPVIIGIAILAGVAIFILKALSIIRINDLLNNPQIKGGAWLMGGLIAMLIIAMLA